MAAVALADGRKGASTAASESGRKARRERWGMEVLDDAGEREDERGRDGDGEEEGVGEAEHRGAGRRDASVGRGDREWAAEDGNGDAVRKAVMMGFRAKVVEDWEIKWAMWWENDMFRCVSDVFVGASFEIFRRGSGCIAVQSYVYILYSIF